MNEGEKIRFVRTHEKEIRPLLDDGEQVNLSEQTDKALEAYETKVMVYERSGDTAPDARKILLEASMPANVAIIKPLLMALEADADCGAVTLLTDNVAGKQFEQDNSLQLTRVRSGTSTVADIPPGPYAAALALDTPANSPTPFVLESAKPVYGTGTLYYWSLQLFDPKVSAMLGKTDAILTTNEFTAGLIKNTLGASAVEIIPVGSPLIDAINPDDGEMYRKSGRMKLGIGDSSRVLLHSSIVPTTFSEQHESSELNDVTFRTTLEGITISAKNNPSADFVLVLRVHPRMKGMYRFPEVKELPPNIQIVNGDTVSYDEAVYAADILCCNPLSTEVILGPYRGRQTVIFAYAGKGQFGAILNDMYGPRGIESLTTSGGVRLVTSAESLAQTIDGYVPVEPVRKAAGSSIETVKKILLSGGQ